MSLKTWQIPFSSDGSKHIREVYRWNKDEGIIYKPSDYEVTGRFVYRGISWNNSTINTIWQDTQTSVTYEGTQEFLDDILLNGLGKPEFFGKELIVTGTIYFKKKGSKVLAFLK